MTSVIYRLFFLLLTIWILLKAIGFAIYSVLVIIFANIMMWIR